MPKEVKWGPNDSFSDCCSSMSWTAAMLRIKAFAATPPDPAVSRVVQVAIERMQVKLSNKMFGERVRWAPADNAAPLEQLFTGLPKSDGEGTQVCSHSGPWESRVQDMPLL